MSLTEELGFDFLQEFSLPCTVQTSPGPTHPPTQLVARGCKVADACW
jgi:hypothetical protein